MPPLNASVLDAPVESHLVALPESASALWLKGTCVSSSLFVTLGTATELVLMFSLLRS